MLTARDWRAVQEEVSLGLSPGPLPATGAIASALAQGAGSSVIAQYVTAFEVAAPPLEVTSVIDTRLLNQPTSTGLE